MPYKVVLKESLIASVVIGLGALIFFQLELTTNAELLEYKPGDPVYRDRVYSDKVKAFHLPGLKIVRPYRHLKTPISITSSATFTIFVAVDFQQLSAFYKNWEVTGEVVDIFGHSLTLKSIIRKELPAGTYFFPPPSLIAASPLFILTKDSHPKIKASHQSHLNQLKRPFMSHKKHYASLLGVFAILCLLLVGLKRIIVRT